MSWEETKEIVYSLDYEFSEEKFSYEIFKLLEGEENIPNQGISFPSFLILLSKEIKEKDLASILIEAFKFLDYE